MDVVILVCYIVPEEILNCFEIGCPPWAVFRCPSGRCVPAPYMCAYVQDSAPAPDIGKFIYINKFLT